MTRNDARINRHDILRDLWLVAITAIVVVATAISYTANLQRIHDTNILLEQVNKRADMAVVESTLVREKVCSASNQGDACRSLFDRLTANISRAQRKQVGCDVLAVITGPGIREIRKASRCPKPTRTP